MEKEMSFDIVYRVKKSAHGRGWVVDGSNKRRTSTRETRVCDPSDTKSKW